MIEKRYEIFLYNKTVEVVTNIMEINCWTEDEALMKFAVSKTYACLEDESTKM